MSVVRMSLSRFAWPRLMATVLGLSALPGIGLAAVTPGGSAGGPPYTLLLIVAVGALAILFLALLASLYRQPLNVLRALEAGGVGSWELSLPERALRISPRGKDLLGVAPEAGFGLADLMALAAPGDEARLQAAIDGGMEYEFELRAPTGGTAARWVSVRGRVVDRVAGRPRRMVGVIFDITERQEAFAQVADSERRQRLLIDELNHRVKNTLAAVQSISRQSAKRAGSIDDFRELFEARLIALSQTHNALVSRSWERAQLDELLRQQLLGPYSPEQVRLDGPIVDLAPREALALGMVFHELATNAAKYGALSTTSGRVRMSWEVISGGVGDQLLMDWSESGGPTVTVPTRRGFGTRMVQGSVMGELGGSAELIYDPGGFRAKLSIPLDFGRQSGGDEPNLKLGVQHGFSAVRAS